MAKPIQFHPPAADDRPERQAAIDRAPIDHAAALLAVYELVQALHDRGVIDTATSAVKAGDDLLATAVDAANTPQAIRALRNVLAAQKVLESLDPDVVGTIPDALAAATSQSREPVRLWTLIRRALSKDTLRALSAGVAFLESLGRSLRALDAAKHKR